VKKFFDAANQSALAVNRKIIDILQSNLHSGLDLAKSLAGAKDPFEFVQLQTNYWLKQFSELAAQAEEVRSRLFGFGATHAKKPGCAPALGVEAPFEQGPCPAAHDSTAVMLERESDGHRIPPPHSARPAESGVRPPDARRRTAEKRSTRLRRATTSGKLASKQVARTSQAETGALKPRRSSGLVAQAGARSASERQSTTQKTTQKKSARQALPNDIKFGMLDGNAVRFTNSEAWWLIEGAWRPIGSAEVLANAAEMREERYNQLFPKVPRLPGSAFRSDHPVDATTTSKTPRRPAP
jgi:hypothetical protein